MTTQTRFGNDTTSHVDHLIKSTTPQNTINTKKSVWRQFEQFCKQKQYKMEKDTPVEVIASILKSWAVNMRKENGEDYKECFVKTIWNVTAKLIQEKYFDEFHVTFNPFSDIQFKSARDARNAKRRILQKQPEKKKQSARALKMDEYNAMINSCDENTPEGLQVKIFHVVSLELAWRGNDRVKCLIHHFQDETNNDGNFSGRIVYNPIFTKTCQGGDQRCADTKWLTPNKQEPHKCPVRLNKKLIEKRGPHITTDRLFLTPNPYWTKNGSSWYKNVPIGKNIFCKWTKTSAEKTGLDVKKRKITNHSSRSTIVSQMSNVGVQKQELIKITGHSNSSSLKPYLQLIEEHHLNILNKVRCSTSTKSEDSVSLTYNNCVFNNCSFK